MQEMFEGKSYNKTIRACLLTCAALHILLFEHPQESEAMDSVNLDDSPDSNVNLTQLPEPSLTNSLMFNVAWILQVMVKISGTDGQTLKL